MTEDRAKELDYLSGSNCDSFTPAIVVEALRQIQGGTITCANESLRAPCCSKTTSIPKTLNASNPSQSVPGNLNISLAIKVFLKI